MAHFPVTVADLNKEVVERKERNRRRAERRGGEGVNKKEALEQ